MKTLVLFFISILFSNLSNAQIGKIYDLNKEKNIPTHNVEINFSFDLVIIDYNKPKSNQCSFTYKQIDSLTGFEILFNGSFKEAKKIVKIFNRALISKSIKNFKIDLGDFRLKIFKITKMNENALLIFVNSEIAGENYFIITKKEIDRL
jgi:hypothetical protein